MENRDDIQLAQLKRSRNRWRLAAVAIPLIAGSLLVVNHEGLWRKKVVPNTYLQSAVPPLPPIPLYTPEEASRFQSSPPITSQVMGESVDRTENKSRLEDVRSMTSQAAVQTPPLVSPPSRINGPLANSYIASAHGPATLPPSEQRVAIAHRLDALRPAAPSNNTHQTNLGDTKAGQAPPETTINSTPSLQTRANITDIPVARATTRGSPHPEHDSSPERLAQQARVMEQTGRYSDALRLYRLAANAGYGPASMRLGELYMTGVQEVRRDYAEAVRWYAKAREQGMPVPPMEKR